MHAHADERMISDVSRKEDGGASPNTGQRQSTGDLAMAAGAPCRPPIGTSPLARYGQEGLVTNAHGSPFERTPT